MALLELTEAWRLVAESVRPLPTQRVALQEAYGFRLAQPLTATADIPPHDRSMLDGVALRFVDTLYPTDANVLPSTTSRKGDTLCWLDVVEEVAAGVVPTVSVESGQAVRIMTGAMVPRGVDVVVGIERVIVPHDVDEPSKSAGMRGAGGSATVVGIERGSVRENQNIQRRGAIARAGDEVLAAGRKLNAAELGLAAEIGASQILVRRRPRAAVITTGNELVPADQEPSPSQIRDSNGPMLEAALRAWTEQSVWRTHSRDDAASLDAALRGADSSGADVIVLAGGVSAGKLDLVPDRLAAFGAECVFHKVSLKPGKPIWFGVRETPSAGSSADQDSAEHDSGEPPNATKRQWIFGLPGNPISSLIGAELFIGPLIAALQGATFQPPHGVPARLASEFTHRGDRPTYWPASSETMEDGQRVTPAPWLGSADLPRVAQADGWIAFPAGTQTYAAGTLVKFVRRSV